jgi:hyperosmotically inducible protein
MENAGTSTGAAAVNTYRGTKTATKDTAITTKIKSALLADGGTKSLHIHVKTVDGVVTLRGVVPSRALADKAEQVAQTTSGVKEVHNRLHVETPTASD